MDNFEKNVHISTPARMRTIKNCPVEMKKIDPGSNLTEYSVRQLVLQRKVKYVRMGVKYLVNFDSLLEYLSNPPQDDEVKESGYGRLRKIGG